jgi:hypothetical protein
VRREEKTNSVKQKRERLVEERSPSECKPGADVHGIPHEGVRASNYETTGWVERGRGTLADDYKRQDAPQSESAAAERDDGSRELRRSERFGRPNARRRQELCWQKNEHEAAEESGVGNRTDEHEHEDILE